MLTPRNIIVFGILAFFSFSCSKSASKKEEGAIPPSSSTSPSGAFSGNLNGSGEVPAQYIPPGVVEVNNWQEQGFQSDYMGPSGSAGAHLFVVIGGNASCNSPKAALFTKFDREFAELFATSIPFHRTVYACYYFHSSIMAYRIDNGPWLEIDENVEPFGFEARVQGLVAETGGPVSIIGHSYGGWKAFKTAAAIAPMLQGRYLNLFTLDPISRTFCKTWKDIFTSEACRGTPPDFSEAEQLAVVQSGMWWNFFQDARLLHSGPTAYALNFAYVGIFGNVPHAQMDTYQTTWDLIVGNYERACGMEVQWPDPSQFRVYESYQYSQSVQTTSF